MRNSLLKNINNIKENYKVGTKVKVKKVNSKFTSYNIILNDVLEVISVDDAGMIRVRNNNQNFIIDGRLDKIEII